MTDPFTAALDADPSDGAARLLYADYLAERGDERAAGVRWMAERGKWPLGKNPPDPAWGCDWYRGEASPPDPSDWPESDLSFVLFDSLEEYDKNLTNLDYGWKTYRTRAAAEDALADVFAGREATTTIGERGTVSARGAGG